MYQGRIVARRIIAYLLLVVVSFLVFNPLWECCDHLDNLRHLGSNGILVILLLVAAAGLTLVKTLRWIWLSLVSFRLEISPSHMISRSLSANFQISLCIDPALPLRI